MHDISQHNYSYCKSSHDKITSLRRTSVIRNFSRDIVYSYSRVSRITITVVSHQLGAVLYSTVDYGSPTVHVGFLVRVVLC